jgi:hypothetical protein
MNVQDSVVSGDVNITQNVGDSGNNCQSCNSENVRLMTCISKKCSASFCELCHPNSRILGTLESRFDSGEGKGNFCEKCLSEKIKLTKEKEAKREEKARIKQEERAEKAHVEAEKRAKKRAQKERIEAEKRANQQRKEKQRLMNEFEQNYDAVMSGPLPNKIAAISIAEAKATRDEFISPSMRHLFDEIDDYGHFIDYCILEFGDGEWDFGFLLKHKGPSGRPVGHAFFYSKSDVEKADTSLDAAGLLPKGDLILSPKSPLSRTDWEKQQEIVE